MRVVFLGPPGGGKGTQAERLAANHQVPHIATGDIFRQAIREGTPMGRQAKEYVDSGRYVPDEIVVGLVRERLEQDDAAPGFVLDGFPRTEPQARALDEMLAAAGIGLDAVILLEVDDDAIVARALGRRVCEACGRTYHLEFDPPPSPDTCECGGRLIQRSDDQEDTVRNRLAVYRDQTAPVINYYRDKGILTSVVGVGTIPEVAQRVESVVAQAKDG